MKRKPPLLSLAVVLLVLVGCTSTAEGTDSGTTSTGSVSAAPDPSTTTSTSTTTTETTLSLDEQAKLDVEAAYLASYEMFVECYRNLPDCDIETEFGEFYTNPTYDRQVEAAKQEKDDGLVYEPPENLDHAQTQILDIQVYEFRTQATVRACIFAGDLEYAVGENGDRTQVGLNDTVTVSWGDVLLALGDDDTWRIYDFDSSSGEIFEVPLSEMDTRIEEATLCGEQDV